MNQQERESIEKFIRDNYDHSKHVPGWLVVWKKIGSNVNVKDIHPASYNDHSVKGWRQIILDQAQTIPEEIVSRVAKHSKTIEFTPVNVEVPKPTFFQRIKAFLGWKD